MGFREQFLGRFGRAIEFASNLPPVRNYRAEKLRQQQAEALLARDDLTFKDIRELGDLAKGTSSSILSLQLITKMLGVIESRITSSNRQT